MSQSGPNFPTVATGNTNTFGGGSIAWTNPNNIFAFDSVFATDAMAAFQISDDLIGSGFGFNLPATAVINGILLEVNVKNSISGHAFEANVFLLNGAARSNDRATGATIPTAATTFSYGGQNDLWGLSWLPSDINSANFAATVAYMTDNLGRTVSVDMFRITVFYTAVPAMMSVVQES